MWIVKPFPKAIIKQPAIQAALHIPHRVPIHKSTPSSFFYGVLIMALFTEMFQLCRLTIRHTFSLLQTGYFLR